MRVFVYEFVTGGGLLGTLLAEFPRSMLAEGTAMATALAADFAAVPDCRAVVLWDQRLAKPEFIGCDVVRVATPEKERTTFAHWAFACDWTVVIAPEFEGHLLNRCRRVLAAGGRLLGPGLDVVKLCADKQATAEHLRRHGVSVPDGRALAPNMPPPNNFPYPAVLKPRDGAGSQDVRLIRTRPVSSEVAPRLHVPGRLERFCPGLAASVACLRGPAACLWLPPCRQLLSADGRFTYQGGSLPLSVEHASRATALARKAVEALPEFIGYLGVDLVLGEAADGSQDFVIEINPRLTTSYVGLRTAAQVNLATAMLELAAGGAPELLFRPVHVQFTPGGEVRSTPLASRNDRD